MSALAHLVLGAILHGACSVPDASPSTAPGTVTMTSATAGGGYVTIAPRTPDLAMHPCTQCHGPLSPPVPDRREPDPVPRVLDELHDRIDLEHGETWCYDCHALGDLDRLRLSAGTLVSFDESYRLCGACHGDKLAAWRADIHGLTTGYWNGPRTRRSCTACHDPHTPAFPAMKPSPPPARPRGEEPHR